MNVSGQFISQQFIALLTLCQQPQSEKDGVRRPSADKAATGVSEAFDDFARQIQQACLYASMTDSRLSMQNRLADTGRQLEQFHVDVGNNYAVAAVDSLERFTGPVNAQ